MARHRFHVIDLADEQLVLTGDEAAHARKSLRLTAGDRVELFDGRGTVAGGRIVSMEKQRLVIAVEDRRSIAPARPRLHLAVAPPKGQRLEAMAEGLTQLGVDRLTLLVTERSVVEPGEGKRRRLDRVMIEAAKQCGRAHLPTIDGPTDLAAFLIPAAQAAQGARAEDTWRAMTDVPDVPDAADVPDGSERDGHGGTGGLQTMQRASETGADRPRLSDIAAAASAVVLVGPEGGWTRTERAAARAAGFVAWSLGPNVLRIETAAMAAAAVIRHAARGEP